MTRPQTDVVTLHCPLLPQTQRITNAKSVALMKPSAFLIDASRGGLVVEQDFADALNSVRLAGVAVDVLSSEPPSPDNPLLCAKNCIVTPHIAWATQKARTRLLNTAVENLRARLNPPRQHREIVCVGTVHPAQGSNDADSYILAGLTELT
jgi:glycerate dehydrogenase